MSRMKESDAFGARMKAYEAQTTHELLSADQPICARIDGRAFSSFTRGMQRPFDFGMLSAMTETTAHLCRETHAAIAYTQSDEITLIWFRDGPQSQPLFGGKVHKMTSVLASMAAAKFARVCPPGFEDRLPHFDCRVFNLPSKEEAANCLLWRAMDARKNAISMVAQSRYSHKALHGVGQAGMLDMLRADGVDFDALPAAFRRGTFMRRETVMRELEPAELAAIPEKHRPAGQVARTAVHAIAMPPFNRVSNRVAVIFDGAAPETAALAA